VDVRRVITIALSFVALASAVLATDAGAALRLDPSFGKGGIVKLAGPEDPKVPALEAVAEEADGGLILAGEGTLQRLDPAGNLDPSFGEGGTAQVPAVAEGKFALAAATVDAQGRIVVVGTSTPPQPPPAKVHLEMNGTTEESGIEHTDVRILRYLPNGTLDPSFGEGGVVESDLGLPTLEVQGVGLAAAPVLKATGVAVDRFGRIVVTGGAAAGFREGCYHDDFFPIVTYAGFVARFTEAGSLDRSFAGGGVFGGRVAARNPLRMEVTTEPAIAPDGEVILQRGEGACPDAAGSLGYFRLTAAGKVRSSRGVHALNGRVAGAAAAADGSTLLLVGPRKGHEAAPWIVELRADGSRVKGFGRAGKRTLALPESDRSYLEHLRVAPDGEIFVGGSGALFGLTARGEPDPRVGPKGRALRDFSVADVPFWQESGGLWTDEDSRPTITVSYERKGSPNTFAAARFEVGG
jgi:uncharacterized delta-60 repeat protein